MPEIAGRFIGWHANSKLLKLEGETAQGAVLHGGPVKDGSLSALVRFVMDQPAEDRWRYSIATDGPMLGSDDIYTLAGKLAAD